MIGDNESNFPHKLLLTNRKVANLRKAFANYLSTDIKSSKTQLSKMMQSSRFVGRLLGPLLKTGLPLIKNVIKPLTKNCFNSSRINCSSIVLRPLLRVIILHPQH